MILEARQVNDREIVVTSRFARYFIEFTQTGEEATISAPGLEETYLLEDFPQDAEPLAVALYLVGQLEAHLIGT